MRRAVLAVAVAALGGCAEPPSVVVYWDFLRHTLTGEGDVVYDADVNVGGGDAECDESGVQTITITDEAGRIVHPELPSIPCVFAGVQGVVIEDVGRGSKNWTITGYRGSVPTYVGTASFEARRDRQTEISVTAAGIPDDLDVDVSFFDARGGFLGATCAAVNVGFLVYGLYDAIGTLVASGDIPCPNPPGLTFRFAAGTGIDRDTYSLRIQGFRDADPASAPVFDNHTASLAPECEPSFFDHFGTDVSPSGWNVAMYDVSDPTLRLCR